MQATSKVLIIGLDCAAVGLVFDQYGDGLPNIQPLISAGISGILRSCDPPITCPAWMLMLTSRNPGQLGIYGFRNRVNCSYDSLQISNSKWVKADTVWDLLGKARKWPILVGVPVTYPLKPLKGYLSSSSNPNDRNENTYTFPPALRQRLASGSDLSNDQ